jgi:hypothetical protein
MDRRTPLQHLLRNFLPTRGKTDAPAPDFMDTCVDGAHATSAPDSRPAAPPRQSAGWNESAIDLELGTEIMEYPDDTAADLMNEFFANSNKKAA